MPTSPIQPLSSSRRRLLEAIHGLGFGSIENLPIRHGEPAFSDHTRIVKQRKMSGDEFVRAEPLEELLDREPYLRLLRYLDQVQDALIVRLEIKHAFPFLFETIEPEVL
jgi:hypothetical protein